MQNLKLQAKKNKNKNMKNKIEDLKIMLQFASRF